jgi:hypothetical protein
MPKTISQKVIKGSKKLFENDLKSIAKPQNIYIISDATLRFEKVTDRTIHKKCFRK